MDHAYLLTWALLPEIAGTMRGHATAPAGIVDLRGGAFRRRQAAFAVDIHNDGWGWATGSPYTDLIDDGRRRRTGSARRCAARWSDRISRQLLLAFMIEVLPEREQPGDRRPELHATSSATCAR